MVLHNPARGDTYLVPAELTAASPRTLSLEHVLNTYEVMDNPHSSCSVQPLHFHLHFILMTDNKIIC